MLEREGEGGGGGREREGERERERERERESKCLADLGRANAREFNVCWSLGGQAFDSCLSHTRDIYICKYGVPLPTFRMSGIVRPGWRPEKCYSLLFGIVREVLWYVVWHC